MRGARGRARRARRGLADAHAHDGRRGGGAAVKPAWLVALPDAEAMRATDRWAIEERGVPSLELMERAGAGLAALRGRGRARRARSRSSAARATTAATAWSRRGCCASGGARCAACCSRERDELRGDAARHAPSASRPSRSTRGALEGARGRGRRDPRHRLRGRGARRGGRRDRGDGRPARSWPPTCPAASNASTGEVEGPAVRARATATFAAGKPGLYVNPGKEHAGEVARDRHRDPARARRSRSAPALIDDARAGRDPAAARATRRSSAPATSSSPAARAG